MSRESDLIPGFMIHDCRVIFDEPLCTLFNLILLTSKFPNLWKIARIPTSPVTKETLKMTDQCLFYAILIKFLNLSYERIYAQVRLLISQFQHGFMKVRSTENNLTCFSEYLVGAMDKNEQIDVIYTDQ